MQGSGFLGKSPCYNFSARYCSYVIKQFLVYPIVIHNKKLRDMNSPENKSAVKHPYSGVYMTTFMAIGIAIGAAFSAVPIGLCIGLAIGAVLDWLEYRASMKRDSDENKP